MKLNSDQINLLYAFTEKHFVEWHDVQTELVDHLANGIEEQWREDPNLSFNEALNQEFKKFGVMGFTNIVEERTKALNKLYWQLIWKSFKTYLKLPRIILSLFFIWLYYEILVFSMQFDINWVLIPSMCLLFGIPWFVFIKERLRSKRIKKHTGKKWLFDNVISQFGGLIQLLNIVICFQVFFNEAQWSTWISIAFSVIVVVFSLILYISILEITPEIRNNMRKQHPEYQFS